MKKQSKAHVAFGGHCQQSGSSEVWDRRELVDLAVARPVMTLHTIMTLAVGVKSRERYC